MSLPYQRPQPKSASLPLRQSSGLRIAGKGTIAGAAAASVPVHKGAEKHWSRGVALAREGKNAEAEAEFEQATALSPRTVVYWLNLASVRRKLRQIGAAAIAAAKAFELDDRNIVACHLLVELLRLNNRHVEALAALRRLHADVPRTVAHHVAEGSLLMTQTQWQAASGSLLQALAMEPGHIEAYTQLGLCLGQLGEYRNAAECLRTVTMLQPHQVGAAVHAAHYTAWACDWRNAAADDERMAKSLELQASRRDIFSVSPFCLLAMDDDAARHRRAAELESRRVAHEWRHGMTAASDTWVAPEPGPAGYPNVTARARKRIGFVSADFRTHATSMLIVQALQGLDRTRFEVVLYSHGKNDNSALRKRVRAAADLVVDWAELSPQQQAERIRDDGIAVLVDLSGHTKDTRLGVFALRPAPVQALWLAYPSTSGADFVDYLIGDPIVTPLEHQADFTECIAQLPVCYEPTDRERVHPATPARAECGLPDDAFVYACFNQSYKITPDVFSRWCRILERVPNAVLWLLVPHQEIRAALLDAARERGLDPARVLFAPFVTPEMHLARLPCADLFLDTFPYGAHTTCSDALWMGLPVLTQVGRSFSARVAASLLSAVGLPELAVTNATDYENLAVLLATDAEALHDIRTHLAVNRLDLPLFDSERFAREFSDLFGRMVQRWEQGLPPGPLAAAEPAVSRLAIVIDPPV